MIYIINEKPYIRVANYYKPVKVEKKNNEYNITPIDSKNKANRITVAEANVRNLNVTGVSVEDYYTKTNSKPKNNIDSI